MHGLSKTPEYRTWIAMKSRCYNDKSSNYKNYGARGIRVCERWRNSFDAFLSDMGKKPSAKHSIDRIKNNGNYEPENCQWKTKIEQENNKRNNHFITAYGVTLSVRQWEKLLEIPRGRVSYRINAGWDDIDAVSMSEIPRGISYKESITSETIKSP